MVKKRKATPVQEPKKYRGIVHSFKSTSNSSKRTEYAEKVINEKVKRNTHPQKDRMRNKIKNVLFVDEAKKKLFANNVIGGKNNGKKIFFSAKTDKTNNIDLGDDGVWVSLLETSNSITVLDTKEGLIHYDKNENDPVFVLLNRADSLKCSKPHLFVDALKKVEAMKKENSTVRGAGKQVMYEAGTSRANYVATGVAPKRAGHGLYTKDLKDEITEKEIKKMTSFIRHKTEPYIHKKIKKALRSVLQRFRLDTDDVQTLQKQKVSDDNMPERDEERKNEDITRKTKLTNYFPSMATGRNTCLEIHADEDCFYSVVVVYCEDDIEYQQCVKKKKKNRRKPQLHKLSSIRKDTEILKYFTFSTGVSVGLRSGDILLFNPLIEHCISSNTDAYMNRDVYCTSFYFKSRVLGLNDNRIPFDEQEEK